MFNAKFTKELWLNGCLLAPNVAGSNPVGTTFLLSRSSGFAQKISKNCCSLLAKRQKQFPLLDMQFWVTFHG